MGAYLRAPAAAAGGDRVSRFLRQDGLHPLHDHGESDAAHAVAAAEDDPALDAQPEVHRQHPGISLNFYPSSPSTLPPLTNHYHACNRTDLAESQDAARRVRRGGGPAAAGHGAMLAADHNRPWKKYQREFRDLETWSAAARVDEQDSRGLRGSTARSSTRPSPTPAGPISTPARAGVRRPGADRCPRMPRRPTGRSSTSTSCVAAADAGERLVLRGDLLDRLRDIAKRAKFREDNLAGQLKLRKAELDKNRADYELAVAEERPPGQARRRCSRWPMPSGRRWPRRRCRVPGGQHPPQDARGDAAAQLTAGGGRGGEGPRRPPREARRSSRRRSRTDGAQRRQGAPRAARARRLQRPAAGRPDLAAAAHAQQQLPRRRPVRPLHDLPQAGWTSRCPVRPPSRPTAQARGDCSRPADAGRAAGVDGGDRRRQRAAGEALRLPPRAAGAVPRRRSDRERRGARVAGGRGGAAGRRRDRGDRRRQDAGPRRSPSPALRRDARRGASRSQLTVRRGVPQPYSTHPRLDLFVGSTSPHPMQTFGCTICHQGQGSATSFKWASHTPEHAQAGPRVARRARLVQQPPLDLPDAARSGSRSRAA